MVGMIGGLPGNAAPEDEEQDGFGVELTDPRTALAQAKALTNKAYDAKAQMLREARTGPSGWQRLSRALGAATAPAVNKTNWDTLRQGLASWTESGEAAREAEEKQRLGLMGLESERNLSLAELEAKYGTKQKASDVTFKGSQVVNGEVQAIYSNPDGSAGYVLSTSGKRTPLGPQQLAALASAPAQAQTGATAAGARPVGGPITQEQFLSLPVEQRVGVEFTDADGTVKRGTSTGGTVEVAAAKPRPATRQEAMARGFFNGEMVGDKFTPASTDESNRVPDISALDADVSKIAANIANMQNLQSELRRVLPLINNTTVGLGGWIGSFIRGTPAYELKSVIDRYIGGNIAFDRLQDMRVNSPTGGALGQVAVQELETLRSSAGNLDPGQGSEALRRGVQTVLAAYDRYIKAATEQLQARQRIKSEVLSARGASRPPSSTPSGNFKSMSDDDLLRAIGGK